MTIIAGFSSSRQGAAPIHLAAQLARTTGDRIIAVAVIERPLNSGHIEEQYTRFVTEQATASLHKLARNVCDGLDISVLSHESTSVPRGLTDVVEEFSANIVVVGSSSSGLLGRVSLGSVTERLVHTAKVPVALAPRGYPLTGGAVQRLTVGYDGAAHAKALLETSSELAQRWNVPLRVASFTVRPPWMFAGAIESSAEELVVQQWARRTAATLANKLADLNSGPLALHAALTIGDGVDWTDAVNAVTWQAGEILVLGSGAAGPLSQVFLGSAAAKILRHAPVPTMIVPRMEQFRQV